MPTVAVCPKCRRPVAVPATGEAASRVRCPLCRAEFQLQAAIEFTPPALELIPIPTVAQHPLVAVVDPPKSPSAGVAGAAESAASSSIPDLLINPEGGYITRPEGEFLSPSAEEMPPAGKAIRAPAAVQAAAPRRRRKQQNLPVDLLKIVVGGLVGLTFGYAVLLWGFKSDPFKLAKRLPSALVPETLHSPNPPISDPSNRTPQRTPGSATDTAPQSISTLPVLPERPLSLPEPETESIGPKSEHNYSLSDFSRSLRAARDAADAMQAALDELVQRDPSELGEIRKQFYIKLAALAEAATLSRDHPTDAQTVQSLAVTFILSVADDQSKLDEFSRLAGAWMDSSNRTNSGVVLAGTVQKVEAGDKLFSTEIKLIGRERAVPIISSANPNLSPGDEALALGVIVTDPVHNLPGYSGVADPVVWIAIVERVTGKAEPSQR